MITITESAAVYIKSKSETGMRLTVKSSGCNGYKYVWAVADTVNSDDIVVESNGTQVLVDKMTYLYVQDSTIDLQTSMFSSALTVTNPQVKNTCGCGESVSF